MNNIFNEEKLETFLLWGEFLVKSAFFVLTFGAFLLLILCQPKTKKH